MTQNKPSGPQKKAVVVTVNGEKVWSLGADIEILDAEVVCFGGSREFFCLTGSGVAEFQRIANFKDFCLEVLALMAFHLKFGRLWV